MPSLQIRQLPDDVYQALSFRAEQAHRSLAQQTVIELRHSTNANDGTRRHLVLQKIRKLLTTQPNQTSAEQVQQWIREDRDR
jgi:antitoxin FitA